VTSHVRLGSNASISPHPGHVCFAPDSDHTADIAGGPVGARNGHRVQPTDNSNDVQIVPGYDWTLVKSPHFVDQFLFRVRISIAPAGVGAVI
jgi:hypothetical protein